MIDMILVWQFFSMFGNIEYWIALVVGSVLIYIALPRKDKKHVSWIVFSLIPAAILAFQTAYFLKLWFQVPRPCLGLIGCPDSYSLPSNHASIMFAAAVVIVLNMKKRLVQIAAIVLAVLVSLSRIALNYHTPLDIIVGSLIGVFSGVIIQKVYQNITLSYFEKISSKRRSSKRGLSRLLGV